MRTTIYFDGGSDSRTGRAYGSYEINSSNIKYKQTWRCRNKTCNEAEYLTLWLALHDYLAMFKSNEKVEIYSDSMLVVQQVNGRWKVKNARMKVLRSKIVELLSQIKSWSVEWNSRDVNVAKFGH